MRAGSAMVVANPMAAAKKINPIIGCPVSKL
jgi:hypothetical protein